MSSDALLKQEGKGREGKGREGKGRANKKKNNREEKKDKKKIYTFWRQLNEKPSTVQGCPGQHC